MLHPIPSDFCSGAQKLILINSKLLWGTLWFKKALLCDVDREERLDLFWFFANDWLRICT